MARSTAATPELTAVIKIGLSYYPVILRPEYGPQAFEHINGGDGIALHFTRRYAAVQYLWRRERDFQPAEPLNPCPRCGEERNDPNDPNFCEVCFQEYAR